LKRNGAWASEVQKKPYEELPEIEKEKDRVIIRKAVEQYQNEFPGSQINLKTDVLVSTSTDPESGNVKNTFEDGRVEWQVKNPKTSPKNLFPVKNDSNDGVKSQSTTADGARVYEMNNGNKVTIFDDSPMIRDGKVTGRNGELIARYKLADGYVEFTVENGKTITIYGDRGRWLETMEGRPEGSSKG
jgi:hypothetical protein